MPDIKTSLPAPGSHRTGKPSHVGRIPLVAALLVGALSAQSGEDIARLIDARAEPEDQTNDLTMILTSRSGSQRTLTVHSVSKGGTRQIFWFLAPADDRGVAFLRIEHEDRDDELRMWLPSFRKMRRIAASRKGESFMGSDLSYEDMTSRTLSDYTYELRGEERLDDEPVWVLTSTPKAELRSSYSELVSWVRKSDAVILKEEYYDRVGNLLKVRTIEVEERQGYVVPVSMIMRNVQKEHTTELHFDKVALDTGVSDDLFHERNLRRLP